MADDFERRWRAAAHANPRRCTYPEAVPGYRANRAAQRRTGPAEGPRKREADPKPPRAAEAVAGSADGMAVPASELEPITWTDRDTGGMIVHWPAVEPKPADAPVTVAEIRQAMTELDQAVRDTSARLATDDAVQALVDAIAKADQPRPWWDLRRWWR